MTNVQMHYRCTYHTGQKPSAIQLAAYKMCWQDMSCVVAKTWRASKATPSYVKFLHPRQYNTNTGLTASRGANRKLLVTLGSYLHQGLSLPGLRPCPRPGPPSSGVWGRRGGSPCSRWSPSRSRMWGPYSRRGTDTANRGAANRHNSISDI